MCGELVTAASDSNFYTTAANHDKLRPTPHCRVLSTCIRSCVVTQRPHDASCLSVVIFNSTIT